MIAHSSKKVYTLNECKHLGARFPLQEQEWTVILRKYRYEKENEK